MRQIALINHGCAKNLVDSELMLGKLSSSGYKITLDETKADIVIINTCSFIHDAEKESVASIFEMINAGKKVIIAGCLPQKHKKELQELIPEALAFVGTSDIDKIVTTELNNLINIYKEKLGPFDKKYLQKYYNLYIEMSNIRKKVKKN